MDVLIALLRGVNVGQAKRVAMADLRALAERLGEGGARTRLKRQARCGPVRSACGG